MSSSAECSICCHYFILFAACQYETDCFSKPCYQERNVEIGLMDAEVLLLTSCTLRMQSLITFVTALQALIIQYLAWRTALPMICDSELDGGNG